MKKVKTERHFKVMKCNEVEVASNVVSSRKPEDEGKVQNPVGNIEADYANLKNEFKKITVRT